MPRRAATCAVILVAVAVAVAGCGTIGEPSGQPPGIVTTAPSHRDAPAYSSCEDFSAVFDSRDENQLSCLPDEHWLIVRPSRGASKIDLANKTSCIETKPA